MSNIIRITEQVIDLQELIQAVSNERNGGIAVFSGIVRRWNEGHTVHWLEYEAYKEAAEEVMREITREVERRWGIVDIAMAHRVGRLAIGDIAVGIAVGSPHRDVAFDACEYAIDALKAEAPIWKKESWEAEDGRQGAGWVANKVN